MVDKNWNSLLPRTLRLRFDGLGSYVSGVLEEERVDEHLQKADVEVIHLLSFLRSLDELFREGTEAATRAVDAFRGLGIASFSIGSEVFAERNDAVMRGDRLAKALRELVLESLPPGQIIPAEVYGDLSLRAFIVTLARRLSNARRTGMG